MSLRNETYGMMKTLIDAHTMGIHSAVSLLKDCGYNVIISPPIIEDALQKIDADSCQDVIVKWIRENNINRLGISYRLDPGDAVDIVGRLVYLLKKERLYECQGALVRCIHFAGLKPACERIDQEYAGKIRTFRGGENVEETLLIMGVPKEDIPRQIIEGCKYDNELLKFGKEVIEKGDYKSYLPLKRNRYSGFGTKKDTLEDRLDNNFQGKFQPLIRAHYGPYSTEMTREQCILEYKNSCRKLAEDGYLDVLSIGTSQLSQSNFGENWEGKINGGGVPVNSEQEFSDIWNAGNPMLVRTYSATHNIEYMAAMYERTINIAWHALSLWWFDELDGRGPNKLYDNLKEHISTMRLVAKMGKALETNVPHHFAFRGCDDVTYIVSAYIAAKMAKVCGVKTFVLQNMLNTPRSTWGIQDIAKSRALINIINDLKDNNFRIILQTRAGLDYFKPDINEAKIQLAAVTALMDDIEPQKFYSPQIIHVVSYSEALFLATPDIINDSIKITRTALNDYRRFKKAGLTPNVFTDNIVERTIGLETSSRKIISAMEKSIINLYSPEGLYIAFVSGWLPVPELWSNSDEFVHAKCWETKMNNGGIELVDKEVIMSLDSRIDRCVKNIPDAEYKLKQYKKNK